MDRSDPFTCEVNLWLLPELMWRLCRPDSPLRAYYLHHFPFAMVPEGLR